MAPKRARERKRQTKISFSPAAKSSPATKPSTSAMGNSPFRPAQVTPSKAAKKMPTRAAKRTQAESSSEDELAAETERGMRLGMPVKSTPHGMFGSSDVDGASSESSEEREDRQINVKPVTRKRRRATRSSEPDNDESTVTVIPRKRQRRSAVKVESSDEEEEQPKKRSKRQKTRRQSTPVEEEEQTPPRSTRRRTTKRRSPSIEEVEEQTPPRRRKLTKRRSQSDDEQTPPQSTRPRATRTTSALDEEDLDDVNESGSNKDDGEGEDLKEDLAFLRSSPLPDRGRLRSTHEKPKKERQKALEALKKRRAGTNEPSSSATPGRKKPVVIESESESELEVIKEEDSELEVLDDIEDDDEDEQGEVRDANALDMFQEGEEDENFIDDNADDIIGEPSATADLDDMRLAFSLSRAKTRDLFKHAVEWMVMKKIHPAFDSTRNIYTLTFRKLDDEVKGLAGSKFTSSAWTPDFTRATRARPDLLMNEIHGMGDFMSPHCAACNRKNHPATWELMLTGQPYDKDTLEPLENDSESDSNSNSDTDSELSVDSETRLNGGEKATYDEAGERLPPESHRFFLGSTCKANAQVAHTLHHWRYHLYSWVKDYLAREGHLTAEKLVQRDKWSDRKREKAAHKIVDRMEQDKEIKKLYKLYKEQVEFALEASNEYKNGWGRRG